MSWPCEGLAVSRSGFHSWLGRPSSARAIQDAKFVTAIDRRFKASDQTYGARRGWRDLLEDGLACGLHRIERLMRQNAMRARPKRRGKPKDEGERSIITDGESVSELVNATGSREPANPRPPRRGKADALLLHSDSKSVMTGVPGRSDPHSDGPCSVAGVAWRPFAACPTL